MHKKLSAFLGVASIAVLVVACTPAATPSTESNDQASSSAVMEEGSSSSVDGAVMQPGADGQEDASSSDAGTTVEVNVGAGMESARTITINVTNFAFAPNAVTVKKGEKITLRLVGGEGRHGFAIPELGINVPVDEGKTVDVDLPTDKTGTFSFRCSIPCGSGHRDMTGSITITE